MSICTEIHIVPASHLDYGWAASPGECFAYTTENIKMAIDDITTDAPGYKFTVEYAVFMQRFLEVYPEYLPIVRELLREGKFEVCPSMSGFIEQFLDGEMVIHQLVRAKEWIRETLGVDPHTVQQTDLPGHIIQLPQFLCGAGIHNLAYSRYHPPVPLHRWRSPDGSEVTACCHRHGRMDAEPCAWEGYSWGWERFVDNADMEVVFKELPREIEESLAVWPDRTQPILMGCESDLQPPDPAMLARIEAWNSEYPEMPIQVSTITQFFERVNQKKLPVFEGEAPYSFFGLAAVYLSCTLEMRRAENVLAAATKWSVFKQHLGLGKVQTSRIERARDSLVLPHDHNTGGRRGEINDLERYKDALHARLEGDSVLQESAMAIAVHINYRHQPVGTYPIVVFNSLSWNRRDVVETYVEMPMAGIKSLVLTDSKGEAVPCQIVRVDASRRHGWSRVYLVFVAPDVPAHGYATYYLKVSRDPSTANTSLSVSTSRIQNRFFDIHIHEGRIQSIHWKGREITGRRDLFFNQVFMVEDQMENIEAPPWAIEENYTGESWSGTVRKVEVVETGPVRAVVRFHGKVGRSAIHQDVILYDELERIDLKHILAYKAEMHTQTRVALPLEVPGAVVTYESPYGTVRLDKDEMPGTFRGQGERWVQKWIDLSNADYGVTVATRQISHLLTGKGIEPILTRTAIDCGTIFHHTEQDGTYTFEHSICPHTGDWKKAASHRGGWELNSPLYPCNMTTCFPIKPVRRSLNLPELTSFWTTTAKNVVITSISPSKDENGLLLRVVEYHGVSKNIVIGSPGAVESAEEVNFLEEKIGELPVGPKGIQLHVKSHGIHTVKVRLGR